MIISARAVFLKCSTIEKAIRDWKEGNCYSVTDSNVVDFDDVNYVMSFWGSESRQPVNAFLILNYRWNR